MCRGEREGGVREGRAADSVACSACGGAVCGAHSVACSAPRRHACPHVSRCPGEAREAARPAAAATSGAGGGAARAGVTMVKSPPGHLPPGQ